ncbi:MFS transporter [Streptomyces sp. NBC_01198]|uniref:MFS transporter n=1 Tax=Streptomyces sp. NBC_01198 TaxID=2903769 RepID=UPI002E15AD15|nr:MFS transporter [Streptomyces sp. NBC_01198]
MPADTPAPPSLPLATGQGRLVLALLCFVGFLDFVDASIVNVALPSIQHALDLSVQDLQWVPSGYLLTYGGLMLLGGRAGDLLGRRRVLLAGTAIVGLSSLTGGFAGTSGVLIGSRLAQGAGAALMLPAALSLLTTTFSSGPDRHKALGAWGAAGGLASAAGVFLGGVLSQGPGWRWVFFVNPPACLIILLLVPRLIPDDTRRPERGKGFDLPGTALVTGGMLLLVYALVKAPDQGWDSTRTVGELAAAAALLAAFLANEARAANPLVPPSLVRIRGLGAANAANLLASAGFLSMFFFATLYMQEVGHYSQIESGSAFLPITVGAGLAAGLSPKLFAKIGTRPVIVAGALVAAGGVLLLSRVPVHGSYPADLLPGFLVMSFGLGMVFVGAATAANAGVPQDQAGLAAALLNTSQQLGGALGLAILSAVSTARVHHRLDQGTDQATALAGGIRRALLVGSLFLVVGAVVALRAANTRGEPEASADPGTPDRTDGAAAPHETVAQ